MVQGTIIIADSSAIIRSGIIKIIQEIGNYEAVEIEEINHLKRRLRKGIPDLLIIGDILYNEIENFLKSEINTTIPGIIKIVSAIDLTENQSTITLNTSKVEISKLIEEKLNSEDDNINQKSDQSELSSREITIIREIALGKTSKEIADNLFISAHTVLTHRKNINKKLEIKTASGLTVYAILNNIVKLEELEKVGI